jgi:DNA-binding IclR family transcriptional regulator
VCQCGNAVSIGGQDIDKVGISVPVMRTGKEVSGSMCLILTKVRYGTSNAELLAKLVVDVAGKISDRINVRGSQSERPAVADCRTESG